jgi:hypothetical protein
VLEVHDGCEVHGDGALDPYVLLPALDWMPWREALFSAADFPDWFDGSLFPILVSAGGDFYAVPLD